MAKIKNTKERKNLENSDTPESSHMNRRKFLKELGVAGAGALSLLGSNTLAQNIPVEEINKPNILLIMTDQQRWDAMSCSGNWIRTPNMDRIANEGVQFTNCVTNSPVCIAARVSLATGLYPHNTGIWQNQTYLMPPNTPTLDAGST